MTFGDLISALPGGRWAIALATHLGTDITNETCSPAVKADQRSGRARAEARFSERFVRVRPPIAGYNCFGHVFAARRTILYDADVELILVEDGFAEIAKRDMAPDDVVVYADDRGPIHVAKVLRREPRVVQAGGSSGHIEWKVLSKFDDVSGEYEHWIDDSSWCQWPIEWTVWRPRHALPRPPAHSRRWRRIVGGSA